MSESRDQRYRRRKSERFKRMESALLTIAVRADEDGWAGLCGKIARDALAD